VHPRMISLLSSTEWSSSGKISARGSQKTVIASSKRTPCFFTFWVALFSSYSNTTLIQFNFHNYFGFPAYRPGCGGIGQGIAHGVTFCVGGRVDRVVSVLTTKSLSWLETGDLACVAVAFRLPRVWDGGMSWWACRIITAEPQPSDMNPSVPESLSAVFPFGL
jgi:hypothetical protein